MTRLFARAHRPSLTFVSAYVVGAFLVAFVTAAVVFSHG